MGWKDSLCRPLEVHTQSGVVALTTDRGLSATNNDMGWGYFHPLLRYRIPAYLKPKHIRLIGLLSRLRAAWETLQEYAMHYAACKAIEFRVVKAPHPIAISQKQVRKELESI